MPALIQGPMASFTSHRHLLHPIHLCTHTPSPSIPLHLSSTQRNFEMTTTKMSDLPMSPQDEIFLIFREFSGILFTFHATSFQPNHDTTSGGA